MNTKNYTYVVEVIRNRKVELEEELKEVNETLQFWESKLSKTKEVSDKLNSLL